MCDKLPDFVQQKGKLFSSAVLGSLGEKDPLVVGPVWEAALMIIAKTEVGGATGADLIIYFDVVINLPFFHLCRCGTPM